MLLNFARFSTDNRLLGALCAKISTLSLRRALCIHLPDGIAKYSMRPRNLFKNTVSGKATYLPALGDATLRSELHWGTQKFESRQTVHFLFELYEVPF